MKSTRLNFLDWKAAAEARLLRRYAINFGDAGFEDAYLEGAWRDREVPEEFVERIAQKYDFDPLTNGYSATL